MKEKHHRSVLKGATWRAVGTLDTLVLSLIFTGSLGRAAAIGGVELFTKIFLYYVHERVWLRIPWAREQTGHPGTPRDRGRRSLVKGLSWRITGTFDTIIIAFLVTGSHSQAFSIGLTEVITKVGLYYLHERVWERVAYGRSGGDGG